MSHEIRDSALVVNPQGLHARPCHSIVTTALEFSSCLRVGCGGREVDGKSILQLMTLSASHGSTLEYIAEGDDAGELVRRLTVLVSSGFGESS